MFQTLGKYLTAGAVICIAAMLSSCGDAPKQAAEEIPKTPVTKGIWDELGGLEGRWQEQSMRGTVYESWQRSGPKSMSGVGGFVSAKGDTLGGETLELRQEGDTLLYIATVPDQNDGKPVPFMMTMRSADSLVFENPAHDYPDRIVYFIGSLSTGLRVRISGTTESGWSSDVFNYTRAK